MTQNCVYSFMQTFTTPSPSPTPTPAVECGLTDPVVELVPAEEAEALVVDEGASGSWSEGR